MELTDIIVVFNGITNFHTCYGMALQYRINNE